MPDLGDITAVWTLKAFLFAAAAGLGFGFVVLARMARRLGRHDLDPETAGWITGALAGWFVTLLVFSQTLAGLSDADPLWPRILSRLGPYLAGSFGAGIGTWLGLRRRKSKEGP
jgi:hypothetical protein